MLGRFSAVIIALLLVAALVLFTNLTQATIVTDGLVSHWTFDNDDIEGEIVKDVWGDNDGTIQGEAKTIAGKIGEAMEFGSEQDYVECPNNLSLNFGSKNFTVCAWVKAYSFPGNVGNGAIAGKTRGGWANPDVHGWEFSIRPGGYYINIDDSTDHAFGTIPLGAFNFNTFYYATFVVDRDNGEVRVYGDGEYLNKLDIGDVKGSLDNDYPLHIGWRIWGDRLDGAIDELTLYNRALEEDEVTRNYNTTSPFGGASVRPNEKLATEWGKIKADRN